MEKTYWGSVKYFWKKIDVQWSNAKVSMWPNMDKLQFWSYNIILMYQVTVFSIKKNFVGQS